MKDLCNTIETTPVKSNSNPVQIISLFETIEELCSLNTCTHLINLCDERAEVGFIPYKYVKQLLISTYNKKIRKDIKSSLRSKLEDVIDIGSMDCEVKGVEMAFDSIVNDFTMYKKECSLCFNSNVSYFKTIDHVIREIKNMIHSYFESGDTEN